MKRLLLLFIPLMFFFSCETDEEVEPSILGTWTTNMIEGNYIVTDIIPWSKWSGEIWPGLDSDYYPELCYEVALETPQECTSLFELSYATWVNYEMDDGGVGYLDFSPLTTYGNSNNSNGVCHYDNTPKETNQIITFYEDGTFTYNTAEVHPELVTDDPDGSAVYSGDLTIGYILSNRVLEYSTQSGTWVLTDNMLALTKPYGVNQSYYIELGSDYLILDRSLLGWPEQTITFDKQ